MLSKLVRKVKAAARALRGGRNAGRRVTVLPDDVFIVSYPKSGNTWTRFLVGNLIYAEQPLTFANIEARVPDIYQHSDQVLRKLSRPRVLKSHEYFDERYPKVMYIVRDPRDVAVSYYHFLIKMKVIKDGSSMETFVNRFVDGKLNAYHSWAENVQGWLDHRGEGPNLLLLRYEDLLTSTEVRLADVAVFLGLPPEPDRLRIAAARSSLETMSRLEETQARDWRPIRSSRLDKPFIRAGRAGAWKSELPVPAAARIKEAWGGLMERLGYVD